jgi:hypothetical protein
MRPLKRIPLRNSLVCIVAVLLIARSAPAAELQPKTLAAWETYIRLTENRIAREVGNSTKFLVMDFWRPGEAASIRAALRRGQLDIRRLQTTAEGGRKIEVDDGMIHHWIGSVFVPDVKLDTLLHWLQDYDQHHRYFPEIEESRMVSRQGDSFEIFFKLRRKKIITVVYNTDHTAVYYPRDSHRAWSRSFTTRIAQLDEPDTPEERELPVGKDGGYLWRLNSYWRFEETDGGVYVECESVSLSRGIPFGFGWIVGGFVESVPRESLENTLTSLRKGVQETTAKR